jgi:NitT/TauT family transport system ATP-binding protein
VGKAGALELAPGSLAASGSSSEAAGGEPLVAVSKLNYEATDRAGKRIRILEDLSLSVRRGEFVSIVGPSGCGKSTVLNFIAGLLRGQQSGEVRVGGTVVRGITRDVGYMFQTHGLLPWRTVVHNVELGLELKGVPKSQRREQALALVRELGLSGFEHQYPAELSGGMRQRAALARTLAVNPTLLLMDEPFGALDAQTKLLVQDGFLALWETHKRTVLFVTHDLSEAILMADRIIVMTARPGRIKKEYLVSFKRPRNSNEIRGQAQFGNIWESIWDDLRDEARLSMQGMSGG